MAISVYFSPQSMSGEQYDEVHRRLAAVGQGEPAGRTYHCGIEIGPNVHVFDVWESQEAFDQFGQVLMPILQEVGVDPGQPHVAPVRYEARA
jgi:hypothetical protein